MSSKEALQQRRKRVLIEEIHPILQRCGVPQQFWPQKIGDIHRGEWELICLESVLANAFVPMWHATYKLKNPETEAIHTFTIRYSNGAVAVTKINWFDSKQKPSILVTRQYRPSTGEWEVEFPQCFTNSPGPGENQFHELQEKKLKWFLSHASKWEKTFIGQFKDDPGTRFTRTRVYFVEIWMTEEQFHSALREMHNGKLQSRRNRFQITHKTIGEIEEGIDDGQLDSLILLGAWLKVQRSKEVQLT